MGIGRVTVELAVVVVHSVQKSSWNNVEVEESFGQSGVGINFPVGAAISNHHTLEVHLVVGGVKLSTHVVLVDLPGQVWHVNSGIRFTRNEKLVVEVLWEFDIPGFKCGESVL
jgi:hypothetical protein